MASTQSSRRKAAERPAPRTGNAANQDRELLKDRAYRLLKELIQSGQFPPQSTLSERQLSERLAMSKTPIRAALELLESQGLVAVSPQKGILVKELSAREIAELFDLRCAVEPFIVAQLAKRGLATDGYSALQANLKQQRMAAKHANPLQATELDIEFHRLLGRLFDNQELNACLERCFDKLHRSILRINRQVRGRLDRSIADHAKIVDQIRRGRAEAASQAMLKHLHFGRQFLLGMDVG